MENDNKKVHASDYDHFLYDYIGSNVLCWSNGAPILETKHIKTLENIVTLLDSLLSSGLLGIAILTIILATIIIGIPLILVFSTISGIIKAFITVLLFLTWGMLRQITDHDRKKL